MKKIVLVSIVILIGFISYAQAPSLEWQKSFGGTQTESAKSIKQTKDGGYIFVGPSNSNDNDVSGNHLNSDGDKTTDYWVVKTDAKGAIQWQKSYGGSNEDTPEAILQTADGGYIVTGKTRSNDGDVIIPANYATDLPIEYMWTIKLNNIGEIQWQHTISISFQFFSDVKDIKQTPDGGYIIAGTCAHELAFQLGNFSYDDGFVMKLNSSGIEQWRTILGGDYHDYLNSIAVTKDGGCIVAGISFSTKDFFSTNIGAFGTGDCWIAKLSSSGNLQWQKIYGGSENDEAFAVIEAKDGNFIVCGYTNSTDGDVIGNHNSTPELASIPDVWILKLDALGTIVWKKCYGGSWSDGGYSVQQLPNNEYIIAGYSVSDDGDRTNTEEKYGFWVFKIDNSGNILWQKSMGGTRYTGCYSLDITNDGGFILAGETHSNDGDVGPVAYELGYSNAWVVKLSPETLSTASFNKNNFTIYPNPTKSTLSLDVPNQAIDKITITDLAGKIILEQTQNTTQVNVQNLASGMYIIQAFSGDQKFTNKFVKE